MQRNRQVCVLNSQQHNHQTDITISCRNVLFRGGNAVDSAIASIVCLGVVNPHNTGIGAGFIMTIYNTTTQRCLVLDARETAPRAANAEMFVNETLSSNNGSVFGYRAIATPGKSNLQVRIRTAI